MTLQLYLLLLLTVFWYAARYSAYSQRSQHLPKHLHRLNIRTHSWPRMTDWYSHNINRDLMRCSVWRQQRTQKKTLEKSKILPLFVFLVFILLIQMFVTIDDWVNPFDGLFGCKCCVVSTVLQKNGKQFGLPTIYSHHRKIQWSFWSFTNGFNRFILNFAATKIKVIRFNEMSFQPHSVDIRIKYLNTRQRQTKLLTQSSLQVRWLRWTNALRRRKKTAPRSLIHFEFCLFHQNRNLRLLHRIC